MQPPVFFLSFIGSVSLNIPVKQRARMSTAASRTVLQLLHVIQRERSLLYAVIQSLRSR